MEKKIKIKNLGKRINRLMDVFDPDCKITELYMEIVEKQMPRETCLIFELGEGNLQEIFTSKGQFSADVGIIIGLAIAQISYPLNQEFESIVNDMKNLIIDRKVLPNIQREKIT
jgi:hypothetical protein